VTTSLNQYAMIPLSFLIISLMTAGCSPPPATDGENNVPDGGTDSDTTGNGDSGGGQSVSAVEGAVTNVAGVPIEGVDVICTEFTTTTGYDGLFRLVLPPGEDRIMTFSREDYITSSRRVDVYQGTVSSLSVTMSLRAFRRR